jgi:hypothetical protein
MNNKQFTQFLARIARFPNSQIWISANPHEEQTLASCYIYPVYDGTWAIYNPCGVTRFPCMQGPPGVEGLSLEEVFEWVVDKETCKEGLHKMLQSKLMELQKAKEAESYIGGL